MAISEHYAQIRRKLGASLILVPGVAAIIRDETGRVLFQKKHDGTWSLPAGAIEPGENPAQAVVREVQEETGLKVKPERIVGVFGGEGFRHQYPNGDQVEYTVVLFECSKEGSAEQFDSEETQRLDYSLRRRLLLWASPIPRRSFRPPVFRRTSTKAQG